MLYLEFNEEGRVTMVHNYPLHEELGLGMTEAELNETGLLIESIPKPVQQEGKIAVLYYDSETSVLSYRYEDRPLSVEEEVRTIKKSALNPDDRFHILNQDELSFEQVRAAKIEQLKYLCTQAIYEGFTYEEFEFGFNENDQANFTQQLLLIAIGEVAPVLWKTKNAGVQEFESAVFMEIVTAAKSHKVQQQAKYWQLEAGVLSATTKDQINAITW